MDRLEIKTNKNNDRFVEIFTTTVYYCQSCSRDFNNLELVYYANIDNNIICKDCSIEHIYLEPRIYQK